VVLGGGYLLYALLQRDKKVRVYKRRGSTGAPSELQQSPQTASEQQGSGKAHPEDGGPEKPSWWKRFFGLE
jgi:hypothetical protein